MVQKHEHTGADREIRKATHSTTSKMTRKKPKAHRISCVLNPLRDEMQNKLEIFYAVCWCRARALC